MIIRIATKSGIAKRHNADIIDKIDGDGRQYSIAIIGKRVYRVVDRDFYGPIWGAM